MNYLDNSGAEMIKDLSPDDRILFNRLLSKLGGWMDGAVDFWPLVCMENLVPDRHQFLLQNCEKIRSLVCVLGMFLAEAHLAYEKPVAALLDRLTNQCDKLQSAFFVLESFRLAPLEQVRSAISDLSEVYQDLIGSIKELGTLLDLQLSYTLSHTPDREQYFRRILKELFNQFRQLREGKQPVEATTSNPV